MRDPEVHLRVLHEVAETAAAMGIGTRGVIASPIVGPAGNREFVAYFGAGPSCAEINERIDEAVAAAWELAR